MKKFSVAVLFLFVLVNCKEPQPVTVIKETKIRTVTADDFGEEKTEAITLADGFQLKLWAPGPLLSNAVAISFDNHGIAYISETSRRKSSDIDIRAHRDWIIEELALENLEDTEALHRRKLDPSLSEENTWQEDFNKDGIHDYNDLMVQSEYVRRVWDSDGDGRADQSKLFADGFNGMLTGVAAGVLNHDGDVYVTAAPDLWKVTDTNGDDVADTKESLSYGYGIHIAYAGHDMSGLTIGPDGKIYWSIGDMGVNTKSKEGKHFKYPNQGAVMRCNTDGSDMEVFAHGLRNPQEIAFNAYGDLISVDNDGDHAGERERFVHILEGSDTGWRINWQYGKYNEPNESYKVWMDEKLYLPHFEGQAAYLLPAIDLAPDGPAGLAYNPGTALGPKWNDYFFASYFKGSAAKSKTQAFKLKPKGASYEIDNTEDVIVGIASTGVTFAPDGALYINDWKDGYALKPEGRVWRLDVAEEPNTNRTNTEQLLASGLKNKSSQGLSQFLAHDDMRIRQAAQFELVKQQNVSTLLEATNKKETLFKRLHAIWGLGQLSLNLAADKVGDSKLGDTLISLCKDEQEHVRAQTAKVIGEAKYTAAYSALPSLLNDESARVKFFAAEALGKLGNKEAFQPLVNLLEQVGDSDPHLRHGIMYALSRLDMAVELAKLNQHASPDVRIGAVVALRHMQSKQLAAFINDDHPLVATEAARAIHDDFSIPVALPDLAKALTTSTVKTEAFLRRAINANLRIGDAASAKRLSDYITNRSNGEAMRTDAMWALGYFENPPVLDRVDGRFRGELKTDLAKAQTAISPHVNSLLEESGDIRAAAANLVGRVQLKGFEEDLSTFVKSSNQTVPVRAAALSSLVAVGASQTQSAFDIALTSKEVKLREAAQSLLATAKMDESIVVQLLAKAIENGTIGERQKSIMSLATKKSDAAKALLETWFDKLKAGQVKPALQLDVLNAINQSSFDDLKAAVAKYEADKDQDNVLALFQESLEGGTLRKGAMIFYTNNVAQCIRCHVHNEMGGKVGPDLTKIAEVLSPKQLLESLVDPNARIAPGYGSVILGLKNESKVNGILVEENDEFITIRQADGELQQIAKAEIAERENAPSGMLSMRELLSKSEIRDLMAFLTSLKSGAKPLF